MEQTHPSGTFPSNSVPSNSSPVDFRLLFESVPGLFLVLAPDLKISAVSDAYLRATMTQRAVILGRSIFDVFPDNPDDPTANGVRNLNESLQRVLRHRAPDAMAVQKYDIRRPESEGGGFEERYWSPTNHPVLDANGNVIFIIHRVEDVTEFIRLKQIQSENDKQTAELRRDHKTMESEIYARAQEIQEVNRQLREAKSQLEERVRERTAELARSNEALTAEIGQSRLYEEKFRQAQKMEAIGRLAGGVAHDFNNLLTIINGYTEMLILQLPPDDPMQSMIAEVHKAGKRAGSLTRQLLVFSRQSVLEPKIIDLNGVVADTELMLRRLIGEDIHLMTNLAPDLPPVNADPGQLQQAIINLAVNARDAMPHGGNLTIETRNLELSEEQCRLIPDSKPGRYSMIAVTDSGCGMSEAIKSRIFEPFFTTKEPGKGTGLGLAMVYGFVKSSGGYVSVYSEVGHGTTFKIYLPQVRDAVPVKAAASRTVTLSKGSETVLLVEDDDAVRALTLYILQSSGYTVLTAAGGREALTLAEQHNGPIHILITDVVMPEMGGRQVAERVKQIKPGIKILYCSGYADDAVVRHGILDAEVAFVQKPYSPAQLAQKVRSVLDG